MVTVTISKKEYEELMEKRLRYEYLHQLMEEDIFGSPPTRDIKTIIKAFKQTNRYNQKFLDSLERGLCHTSHFRK